MLKKFISGLLSASLMLSMVATTAFAEDAVARSMDLADLEGEVTIANMGGKTLKVRKGSKLHSGYGIDTVEGYAWINLDDSKLIKLDWNTVVTIKKEGDFLEVLLESGEIFFDVSEPLQEEETLHIRTSTMYTSIRGTMGTVSVKKVLVEENEKEKVREESKVVIYEGEVLVTTTPQSEKAQAESVVVRSAQKVRVRETSYQEDADETLEEDDDEDLPEEDDETGKEDAQSTEEGDKKTKTEKDVDILLDDTTVAKELEEAAFAAVEIAKEETRVDRIVEAQQDPAAAKTEVEGVVAQADENLEEKQEQVRKENTANAEEIQQAIEDLLKEDPAPSAVPEPTPTPAPDGGVGEGGAADTTAPSTGDTTTVVPVLTEYTVTYQNAGATFAIQTVIENDVASKPLLMPSASGVWQLAGVDYDFATPVTEAITLTWAGN